MLDCELAGWRSRPYAELAALVDVELETRVVAGASGERYQVQVQVFWDARPGGDVRVMAAIDDGGLRAFVPLTASFILAPDGSFVGEEA